MADKHNKADSFPLIIGLLASVLLGIFGIMYIADFSRRLSNDWIRVNCDKKALEFERRLSVVEKSLDAICENIGMQVTDISALKDVSVQNRINLQVENIFKSIYRNRPDIKYVYFRYNPYLTGSDVSGISLEVKADKLVRVRPRPIFEYDANDTANVGWYYLPVKKGSGCWIEPFTGRDGNRLISYEVPVYSGKFLVGVAGVDLDFQFITNFVDSSMSSVPGNFFLSDHSGKILNSYIPDTSIKTIKVTRLLVNDMYFGLEVPVKNRYAIQSSFSYKFLISLYAFLLLMCLFWLIYRYENLSRTPGCEHRVDSRKMQIACGIFVATVFLFQIVVFVFGYRENKMKPVCKVHPLNKFEETLDVTGESFMPPYIFAQDGNLEGYDVELFNILANRMGFNVRYDLKDWKSAISSIEEGKADVILGCEDEKTEKNSKILHSSAITGDIFVIAGKIAVHSLNDFSGKKIACIDRSDNLEFYGITTIPVYFDNYIDQLSAVESNLCDYALIRENVFDYLVESHGIIDLSKVYLLMNSALGIGVSKDNADLLDRINKELFRMGNDGTLQKLNDKWFSFYKPDCSVLDILRDRKICYAITSLMIFCGVVAILFIGIKGKSDEGERISRSLWLQLEALARNYVSMYLFDMKLDTFQEYKSRKYIRAVLNGYDSKENARSFMPAVIRQTVNEKYVDEMLKFTDLDTLQERIKGKTSLEIEFLGNYAGWCRGRFIALDIDSAAESRFIIWAVETIDKEKKKELELRHKSEIDLLTGINNRGAGEARVRELLEEGKEGLFCLIDVDKFKTVNDTYGHGAGDKVLVEIARCLCNSFRDNDVIVRFGGDEFAVYALGVTTENTAKMILDRFFLQIKEMNIPELNGSGVSVSVGGSFFTESSQLSFEEIYRRADQGAYCSKAVAGNFYTFYKA